MDKNEIRAQLCKLPIEASVALAVRVGLRVLPWLAMSNKEQVLMRWPEKYRAKHALAIWLVYDVALLGVWDRRAEGLRQVVQTRRNAVDYEADPSTYAVVYAAVAAEHAVSEAYPYPHAAAYAADAADSYSYAASAYNTHSVFNQNLKRDFEIMRNGCVVTLIESPLWMAEAPAMWDKQLARFQIAMQALDSGFDFWLDWYEARCRGDTVDVELLKKRVFLHESITSQSPKKINAYLASLTQGLAGAPLNRVRTIFIGDGEAGKTSLIRVLHGEAVVEGIEEKTPGIEIREWKIPETDITASFWDFGGQVMVHATHQLFLRESCLYVLLVSAREKEKATERAEYWLEHVKSFGKSAPVLIVANKADKEPVRLDESLLMDKYPGMIGGFFQLSCTDVSDKFRSRFEEFHETFCEHLQKVGLHQVQFMKPHFAVLQNLRERTPSQAFLTHADYNALCDVQKVDAHGALDRHWLLDILDKLGVIVHFPDMVEMDEYILNPRWLTYGVYTLMYNEQARLTRAQAVALLAAKPVTDQYGNQLSYPASKCRIVFESMRKYKLCYFLHSNQNPDQDQIIIPALLPSDIKQHGFDTASALEFHYQFESFLPRHLISELIVECHTDIANRDGQDIVWQHGVLLDNTTHQTQALIQADYHFRRLSIWLSRGPRMADMLALLRDRIEKIVVRIDIEYEQKVRLPNEALTTPPRPGAKPAFANFLQLREMLADGQDRYVHEFGGKYSISKILGLFEPKGGVSGNTNINISGSTIIGNVTAASEIANSLNEEN
jgi:GTPase SAR1 family protein